MSDPRIPVFAERALEDLLPELAGTPQGALRVGGVCLDSRRVSPGDAFIAFPGGTGTLEEIAEVMSRVALGQLDAPCILYNLNGYYDGLRTQLAHMIELGLSSEARQRGIYFADDLEQIRQLLNPACAG